jgi:hypothetical protein
MDLSNYAAVLEEVKRRFPLGCTVVDSDGDSNVITRWEPREGEKLPVIIAIEGDKILYWSPSGRACYLYYRGKWSIVIKPPQSTLSPLQEMFSKFINP